VLLVITATTLFGDKENRTLMPISLAN